MFPTIKYNDRWSLPESVQLLLAFPSNVARPEADFFKLEVLPWSETTYTRLGDFRFFLYFDSSDLRDVNLPIFEPLF